MKAADLFETSALVCQWRHMLEGNNLHTLAVNV